VFAGTNTIEPLDPSIIPPAEQPPGLEQFILDNAGDVATPADGFDQVFLETVGIVDALDSALATLEGDLLAAFAEADAIDAAPVGDTAAGFDASLGVSSTAVDDLGTLLSGVTPPTPPAPGGGGGAAGNTLDFVSVGPLGKVCTYPLTYQNNTGKTDTITKWTLDNDSAGVFTVIWATPQTLADQGTSDLVVTATATQLGVHQATFTIFTSNEPAPFVVVFTISVVNSGVPCAGQVGRGGGGAGGGGGGRGRRL
jgi:hypothetical protein